MLEGYRDVCYINASWLCWGGVTGVTRKSLLPGNSTESLPPLLQVESPPFTSKCVSSIDPQISVSEALRKPWGKALLLPSLGRSTSRGLCTDCMPSYWSKVNYLDANNFSLKWELKYVLLKLPKWGREEGKKKMVGQWVNMIAWWSGTSRTQSLQLGSTARYQHPKHP